MSDDLGDAITRLIRDVAASPRAADVATRWGLATASQLRPDGIRIECPVAAPFSALELRPWDADGYGLVDVELRPGTSTPWPGIRDRFGPFDEAPATEGSGRELVARQPVAGGASVTLVVELDDEELIGLAIRRDRTRSG